LLRRFPGSPNPVRRSLGQYGELSLTEAREKAREWLALIKRGIDPSAEIERQRQAAIEAERAAKVATFEAAFSSYVTRKASKLKTGRTIENELRRVCAPWMQRPLNGIHQINVKVLIGNIAARGHCAQAHWIYSALSGVFDWLVDDGQLEISPMAKLKPTVLIGRKVVRTRPLQDHELRAYWRANEVSDYPFGKLFQFLAMIPVRLNEGGAARWREFDLDQKLWLIPGARMKNGAPFAVPLTSDAISLLEDLPHFTDGDFLFSTTGGRRPVSGFSKAKVRLDALMKADLEAQGKQFEPFVLHDIRRTVRTRLSGLPIEGEVKELLLAHARPGLHKVYGQYSYLEEKRRGLELWHARLRAIVEPKPREPEPAADNVVPFAKAG
jgi:integrase